MSSNQRIKRIERKVATKTRIISRDVQRGILWAGEEIVRNGKTVGRDAERVGKKIGRGVERGGRRISRATRQRMTRANERLQSRNQTRGKKA